MAVKVGFEWESPDVPPEGIFEGFRYRIYDHEMGNHVQTEQGRCCCKLPQPLNEHHIAIGGLGATGEDVGPTCNTLESSNFIVARYPGAD